MASSSGTDDYDSDEEVLEIFAALHLCGLTNILRTRNPQRTCSYTGLDYTKFLMDGSERTIKDILRMNLASFQNLVDVLVDGGYLKVNPRERITATESVALFLYVLGQNERHRATGDRFQHSTYSTSGHFMKVLDAVCQLAKVIIHPPDLNIVHPTIFNDSDKYPWFKDCIGAIDGTLIDAFAPADCQDAYRARKDSITQNVLAAVDFDCKFTFIYAGWEGSAHDNSVLMDALTRPTMNFPIPPSNKYYLVDAGYANMSRFLAPYRKTRYFTKEFAGVRVFRSKKELFNFQHSSLWNTMERAFGIMKGKFPILNCMPNYPLVR